jgi:hypothetical protein
MLFILFTTSALLLSSASCIAYLVWKETKTRRKQHALRGGFVNLEIDGIDFDYGVEDSCLN